MEINTGKVGNFVSPESGNHVIIIRCIISGCRIPFRVITPSGSGSRAKLPAVSGKVMRTFVQLKIQA